MTVLQGLNKDQLSSDNNQVRTDTTNITTSKDNLGTVIVDGVRKSTRTRRAPDKMF